MTHPTNKVHMPLPSRHCTQLNIPFEAARHLRLKRLAIYCVQVTMSISQFRSISCHFYVMGMHSYMEGMPFWLSRPIIFGIHVEFAVCVCVCTPKNDPKNTTSANLHILTSFSVVLGRKLMQKATQLLSCLVPFVSIKAGNPRRPFWSRTKVTSQTSGCFLNIPAALASQGKGKKKMIVQKQYECII